MIQKLPSHKEGISLYIFKDILFVHFLKNSSFYGFRGVEAIIFLLLEESSGVFNFKRKLSDHGISFQKYKNSIEMIKTLLNSSKQNLQKPFIKEKPPLKKRITKNEVYFFKNYYFTIIDKENILSLSLESLAHLKVDSIEGIEGFEISITQLNRDYTIELNGKLVKKLSSKKEIIPFLYGLLRTLYVENIEFLITLHAASLNYKDKLLIMPALSGKGKSTLSGYLLQDEFSLFSDELSVIKADGSITSIPLGVGIKEGSWNIFNKILDKFSSLESYSRYDGQQVKYFIPKKFYLEDKKVKGAIFIFPSYSRLASNILKKIDILEALQKIMQTQYYFSNLQDTLKIEKWLDIITSCEFYILEYNNLSQAKEMIKDILK